jgi:chemotaxis protein histidine kinase CheA
MADPESDLAARIAVIKQEFLMRLNDHWVPNLHDMHQRFIATPADPALLDQMLHAAHDMTGSGAIFGYEEITNHGRRLDDSLRRLIKRAVEDTPECRREILALLDALEKVCVAALSDLKTPGDSARA